MLVKVKQIKTVYFINDYVELVILDRRLHKLNTENENIERPDQ